MSQTHRSKHRDFLIRYKTKIQLYIVSKDHISKIGKPKVKRAWHVKKRNTSRIAILTSEEKNEFRVKIRDQWRGYILIRNNKSKRNTNHKQ